MIGHAPRGGPASPEAVASAAAVLSKLSVPGLRRYAASLGASSPFAGARFVARRPWALPRAAPARSASVGSGAQTRHNARRTEVRVVHYRWHPLHGREVLVCVDERFPGVLRCFGADDPDRYCLVPSWMFDASVCARMRLAPEAHVSWQALADLKCLVEEAGPNTALDERLTSGRHAAHETTNSTPSAGAGIRASDAADLEVAARRVSRRGHAVAGAHDQGTGPVRARRRKRSGGGR